MTTGDTYALDFTVTQIISETYDLLGVASDGEPIDGDLTARAMRSLQQMIKLWESQGIHLWTMTEGHMWFEVGRDAYDFRLKGRGTGDVHLANTFEQRALAADANVSDLTVTLDSVTNDRTLAGGDLIGILGNTNDLEWFTVMEVTGTTVALSSAVTSAATDGNIVYTYPLYASTTLDAGALAAATTLGVTTTTVFTAGDTILVLLDDGTTDTRVIDVVNDGPGTIELTAGITSAAAAGNGVVNLSNESSPFAPVKRITLDGVRRRESTDYEIPIVHQSREDYFNLPNKNENGTVIQTYYSRQRPQGIMYCWNPPSSARSLLNFTYERSLIVPTLPTQTLDLPEEWYDGITFNLAKRLKSKVGCSAAREKRIDEGAQEFLDNVLAFDQDVYPVRLKPQKYG